jgi:hypothetical protein
MGELLFSEKERVKDEEVERLIQNDEHLNSGSRTELRQFEECRGLNF